MGEPLHSLKADHIRLTVRIMYVSSIIFVIVVSGAVLAVARLFSHT